MIKRTNMKIVVFVILCECMDLINGICPTIGSTQYGVSIVDNTILSLNIIGYQTCIKECKTRPRCRSVDFNRNTLRCDLKSKALNDAGITKVSDVDNWHVDVNNVNMGFPDCSGLSCSLTDKCLFSQCFLVECPPLPVLKNGYVLPTNTLTCGGTRTYQCSVGYTGRGNPNITLISLSAWSTLHLKCYTLYGDWILLARFKTAIGDSVRDSWVSAGTSSETDFSVENGCTSMDYRDTCTKHYRTSLVDDWSVLGITEVKIEMYKLGVLKANVHLNGAGTTSISWFSLNQYISSGWTDIYVGQTILYFGFDGFSGQRMFYIQRNHGGCNVDNGWMAVSESNPCVWDYPAYSPAFTYSPFSTYCHSATELQRADVLAISVKASNFP